MPILVIELLQKFEMKPEETKKIPKEVCFYFQGEKLQGCGPFTFIKSTVFPASYYEVCIRSALLGTYLHARDPLKF